MKGTMKVPKLNKSGLFISELDWDDTYKEKENPKGNFVMVIEPLEGFDEDVIYYEKLEDGFVWKIFKTLTPSYKQRTQMIEHVIPCTPNFIRDTLLARF